MLMNRIPIDSLTTTIGNGCTLNSNGFDLQQALLARLGQAASSILTNDLDPSISATIINNNNNSIYNYKAKQLSSSPASAPYASAQRRAI